MLQLKHVSPREAYAAYMLGSVLVDVREPEEARHQPDLRQLRSIPVSELNVRYTELPSDRPVVLLSKVGNKSADAARFLLKHGFGDVSVVDGGLRAWAEEGMPVK